MSGPLSAALRRVHDGREARWWRVHDSADRSRSSAEATTDRIIGRREELQAVARFVDAVPADGHALLLEGDAGIGKTSA